MFPALEPPVQIAQQPDADANAKAVVPFEPNFDDDIEDTDWLKIFCEVEEENSNLMKMPAVTNTTMMQQHNSPMFANCKIGNINISIHKK